MSGIVCAIRGGPDSRATITTAISLALKVGQPLYFLYVVNLDFLSRTSSTRVHTISKEMQQMGEFILLAAQASAKEHSIAAEGIVRQGNVSQEIVNLCHELSASYLVLGQPRLQREESIFSQDRLVEFVEQAEMQTGAKVILADGGAT